MKIFLLICLAVGWASTEKLDRTYLPPPGSKFSGGSPGDIQVPLEFPKETYPTKRPQAENGVPEIELGINRRPLPTGPVQGTTQRPDGFTYFQNSYNVPKTTTSYAFTQTTTFAPVDYDGLNENSGFLNASTGQNAFPQYPQLPGQNYQQRQPIRGQSPSKGPNYNHYQQGQNFQSTLTPYGSTTQNPRAYLPPVSSYNNKGQLPSGQDSYDQGNGGYPSGQPQGPKYQDGQGFISTTGPGFVEGGNKQNVFIGNPTTASPQYQNQRYISTAEPVVTQQKIGSRLPAQQNERFQGQNFPSSTNAPQFTTPDGLPQNMFTNQNFPSSTSAPQYQYGQRIATPGSNQQAYGTKVQHQNQSKYPGNQNYPSTTSMPQYQDEQQFVTPGLVQQNQYTGNQNFPSTAAPQYQNTQRYSTPGIIQKDFDPNQQKFVSQIPNQNTQSQYIGNQNFPSTTAFPQLQNGQRFTTSGTVQQQESQYPGKQIFPSSTTAPQYQHEQRFSTPGTTDQFGSPTPGQQNQNQYPGNQFVSSTTVPFNENGPQKDFVTPGFTQQGQNQYRGNPNIPSSTASPQYQNGQPVTPGFVQNQYSGNQNVPSTASPQIQNGQRFTSQPPQVGPNRQNYPGSQMIIENGQQYPSSVAPQYQSILAPISGSNQAFIPNLQNLNHYPGGPGYNQQFPSTTAPQVFPQQQYDNDGKLILPNTGVSYTNQGAPTKQTSPGFGNQPSSPTGSPVYGTTPIPGYINQGVPSGTPGSLESATRIIGQNRPERPQAASDRTAEIINYENVLTPDGYSYSYDTSNGIHADETGVVGDGTKAQGGYSYIGDDGKVYSVFYSADENGFQPRGEHLPTPPPIPEAIQRVIEQAHRDKEAGILDDGLYDEEKYGHTKYDGSLNSFRPRNKTNLLVNGVDIPNSYETRIGVKNRNQLKNKGQKKPNYQNEEENTDLEDVNVQDQIDNENFDDSDGKENDRRVSDKYLSNDKDVRFEDKNRKIQKGKNNSSNSSIGSIKNRKPFGGKRVNTRPVSNKTDQESTFDNMPVTKISEGNDNIEGSKDYDDESDLINYKDDPNSRTDFHGINRYLPNPKGSIRFNQTDNKRVSVRPGGTKQKETVVNKYDRTGNRMNQANDDTILGTKSEQETSNDGIRVPNKSRIGQKNKESSKMTKQEQTGSYDESDTYGDDEANISEKYASDDKLVSSDGNLPTQSGVYKSKQNYLGKPKRPNVNERAGNSKNNNIKTVFDEETGYEYSPPQRKFNSEGAMRFPSRTSATGKPQSPEQGIQTTVRPFMTPNVYGNDETNKNDEDQYDSDVKLYRPVLPTTPQVQDNPEHMDSNDRYNGDAYKMSEKEIYDATGKPIGSYGTMPTRRPFGKPQTTALPGYKDQDTIGQDRYNKPINQGTRRPGNKVTYTTDTPKGTSRVESNSFVSTSPVPSTGYETYKDNRRPNQNKNTDIPNDGAAYFEGTAPSKDGQRPTYRPETTDSRGQVPSSTFRPNYVFGDKTLAPNGPVAVDGFGRPISSTNTPIYGTTGESATQDSRIPIENEPGKMGEFRPNVGRFGVTSAPTKGTYEGSTPGPVEDFSGPKHPQRFDPDTGYHY